MRGFTWARSILDREMTRTLAGNRHAWLQVLRGTVNFNGLAMFAGDGAAVSEESNLVLRAESPSEVLLFDLA